jgi:hypothetical protein
MKRELTIIVCAGPCCLLVKMCPNREYLAPNLYRCIEKPKSDDRSDDCPFTRKAMVTVEWNPDA